MEFGSTLVLCCDPSETVRVSEKELQEPLRITSNILEESHQTARSKSVYGTAGPGSLVRSQTLGPRMCETVTGLSLLDMLKGMAAPVPTAHSFTSSDGSLPTQIERNNHEYHIMVRNLKAITTALKANPSAFQSLSLKLKEKEWQQVTDSPTEEELVCLVTNRIKLNASQFEEFLAMVNDVEGLDLVSKRLIAGQSDGANGECATPMEDGIDVRPADTNIVALRLNWLETDLNIHSGYPVSCVNTNCGVVLSCNSKLAHEKDQQLWECEFCGTKNTLDISPEDIPASDDTSFIMSHAPMLQTKPGTKMNKDVMLVFCVDTSGSMCVTSKIKGLVRSYSILHLEEICQSQGVDRETQYRPGETKNETYISRMEIVQDALVTQIKKIANSTPSVRVALVSFSNEVHIHGDCTKSDVALAGERLESMDEVMKKADRLPMPGTIRKCHNSLEQKIQELQENGQTALGPALLVSIVLAGKIPGSKVILCTDGKANVGVGNLDCEKDDEKLETSKKFYKKLGAIALAKQVNVSVITFKDTDCGLNAISHVVNATRGDIVKVDPKDISGEFSSILANPAIATDVTCKLFLHKELKFFNTPQDGSVLDIPLGSVKKHTEMSYEFEVRDYNSLKKRLQAEALQVSFQLQVSHVLPDGSHVLRVVTKMLPVTHDRKKAENDINITVVGYHTIRSAASLTANDKFQEAQVKVLMGERMMKRARKTEEQEKTFITILGELVPLDDILQKQTKKPRRSWLGSQLDDVSAVQVSTFQFSHSEPSIRPFTPILLRQTSLPTVPESENMYSVFEASNKREEVEKKMEEAEEEEEEKEEEKNEQDIDIIEKPENNKNVVNCKPKNQKEQKGETKEKQDEKMEEKTQEDEDDAHTNQMKTVKSESKKDVEDDRTELHEEKEEAVKVNHKEDLKKEKVVEKEENEQKKEEKMGKSENEEKMENKKTEIKEEQEETVKPTALDINIVLQAIEGMEEKWYNVGNRLGLSNAQLDTIDDEYESDGCKLQRVVRVWLENGTNCSWQVMYSALNHRIVHELHLQLFPSHLL